MCVYIYIYTHTYSSISPWPSTLSPTTHISFGCEVPTPSLLGVDKRLRSNPTSSNTTSLNSRLSHTCHILPPSEIVLGLCLAVFAGSGGKYLFHRIGWKGRIWQLCIAEHRVPHDDRAAPLGPPACCGERMYACMCIYIYIYIYMCMHMYIYIYMYTHTHIHVSICRYRYRHRHRLSNK